MPSWRWILWTLLIAGWTAALVVPVPQPDSLPLDEWVWSRRILVAKALHVGAYAFLMGASAWLPIARGRLWWIAVGLLAHGAATEWVQLRLLYRDGSVRDALFDALGVALGAMIAWLLRRAAMPLRDS